MNMLIPQHYTIVSESADEFVVRLLPEAEVYKGHFPGNPISPGVCNIQLILECAERKAGRPVSLAGIRQCRMTRILRPGEEVPVRISLQDDKLEAEMADALILKATIR